MVYSARTMALLLAVFIALVTVLFLSLVQSVTGEGLIVAGVISFSGSYLLIYVVLEFLFFREINRIYKMLEKLRKKELTGIQREKSGALNPLKNINDEIYSFALLKQKEIDELRKLEAFRREFIADVSHELKTPLQSLGTASELLVTRKKQMNEENQMLIDTIREDVERIRAVAVRVKAEVDAGTENLELLRLLSEILKEDAQKIVRELPRFRGDFPGVTLEDVFLMRQ